MKNECNNYQILNQIEGSFDRLSEANWWICMMQTYYHHADQFRWSLNSFLRSFKEIIQILTMELQVATEHLEWFKAEKALLNQDPIVDYLHKQRDISVHRSMLKPASKGVVGFARGKVLKLGMQIPIDPLANSESAILDYIEIAARKKDMLGILYEEEDGSGEYTCVKREWHFPNYPDVDISSLACQAWQRTASLIFRTGEKLGAAIVEPELVAQPLEDIQIMLFDPKWIKAKLAQARKKVSSAE